MVNDHSTDGSEEIVEEWTKKDSRIRNFLNPAKGIIPALQHAFFHSSGRYITRMDSDDIMVPNRLESMVGDLKKSGTGHVALGLVEYFSEKEVGEGFLRYQEWLNGLTQKGRNYSDLYRECVIPSPCWMVYREDFEKCGGFSSEVYPEDYDLVFRMYRGNLKCIPSTQILHKWRDYSYRTSRTHVHYADNTFIQLKVANFVQLHWHMERPLILWGAGKKGKLIAKNLQERNIEFHWVCDNPKKVGKDIYGQKMLDFRFIDTMDCAQHIVAVANPQAQMEIELFFEKRGKKSLEDYFFFC